MIRGLESITINSPKAGKLADFYKRKVGLKLTLEAEMAEGQQVFGFDLKKIVLYVIDDAGLAARNKDSGRVIFSLEVDDIEKESARLEKAGAKKLMDFYHLENYGYIAPFEDPDGNQFRLVQVRES